MNITTSEGSRNNTSPLKVIGESISVIEAELKNVGPENVVAVSTGNITLSIEPVTVATSLPTPEISKIPVPVNVLLVVNWASEAEISGNPGIDRVSVIVTEPEKLEVPTTSKLVDPKCVICAVLPNNSVT